jgi:hypothetical protein
MDIQAKHDELQRLIVELDEVYHRLWDYVPDGIEERVGNMLKRGEVDEVGQLFNDIKVGMPTELLERKEELHKRIDELS